MLQDKPYVEDFISKSNLSRLAKAQMREHGLLGRKRAAMIPCLEFCVHTGCLVMYCMDRSLSHEIGAMTV